MARCLGQMSVVLLLAAGFAPAAGLQLSGKVLNPDSTARSGVKVTLASSGVSATTDASGSWTQGGSTGLQHDGSVAGPITRHLALDHGRLLVSYQGRDPSGRSTRPSGAAAGEAPTDFAQPSARAAAGVDTLIYAIGTKVFLRDTISADRSGMVRVYDTTWKASIVYGWLTDSRDGRLYRTVKIGRQTWMAQNLDYRGAANDTGKCYNDTLSYCARYGRLYTWIDAMKAAPSSSSQPSGVRGVCPGDWHIPSDSEWQALEITLGMTPEMAATLGFRGNGEGSLLRSMEGWVVGNARPFDKYGFRGLPAGYAYSGGFLYLGYTGMWWTATEYGSTGVWTRDMSFSDVNLGRNNGSTKNGYGRTVRCVMD